MPKRVYKLIGQTKTPDDRFIPERLHPPIGVKPDDKDYLDKLKDHDYVVEVLKKSTTELHALMASEKERRRSFRSTWQFESIVKGSDLAIAGFFFLNNNEQEQAVQCVFCLGIITEWIKGDKPMEKHRKHYSFCNHAQGKKTNNVPFDDIGSTELLERCHHDPRDLLMEDPRPLDRRLFLNIDPCTPEFDTFRKRKLSYNAGWPPRFEKLVERLSEAGFYNSEPDEPTTDIVECFSCGGTLQEWLPNDNPWEEHAKWYYKCPFLIKSQGNDWIESIRAGMDEEHLHESENMAYKISTFMNPDNPYLSIGMHMRRIRATDPYKFVYKVLQKSYDCIMLAHQVNNWDEYEDHNGLLQCMYDIEDGEINPKEDRYPQAPQKRSRFQPEIWHEEELIADIIKGDELTEVYKNILSVTNRCSLCQPPPRLCGAVFKLCGCLALCNTCRITTNLPKDCPLCNKPVLGAKLADSLTYRYDCNGLN